MSFAIRPLLLGAALCAAGCMDSPKHMTEDPTGCEISASLDGATGSTATPLGPTGSANVCLHLDGTRNRVAHFAASTEAEDAVDSSFTLTLTDADGVLILDGWDVTVGESSPRTFANLEWDLAGGLTKDVVLELRGTAQTKLSVALFEPLE
jgi:hypothetical protein